MHLVDDNFIMPFGAHKGVKIANVPAKYLLWLRDQDWCDKGIKRYIGNNLEILQKELENSKQNKGN